MADIISGALSYLGARQQAKHVKQAGKLQAQGDLLNAAGLRASALSLGEATQFNLQVQKNNEFIQLQNISRQFQRTLGNNISAVAAGNINIHSKSALMVQSEVASTFERALLNTKLNFENQRRATLFDSQTRQVSLENQARGAEFQAQADRVLASNSAADVELAGKISLISGAIGSASSMASGGASAAAPVTTGNV